MEEQKEDFSSTGGEWTMVRIIEACVSVIRRAQGKKNPDEVQFGTPEWHQVADEFVRDVYRGRVICCENPRAFRGAKNTRLTHTRLHLKL
ncbi:hypothetical protein ACFPTO_24050 [Paraburkholderia denitrificans]|uniref:Uncharacterized protein n=1 Tax=Paraburkholderia denitrificans TaxID=694025 RepID=A0ABW0JG29_9BURK